eukprot:TRINITY_DN17942_c0_g1_i1.p1 TRINITY_DN17942_c0_g1~~TRINITY_DN17942_c0_g1_i1.p1  ORF type:complete len:684 (+),score=151.02 TRINITY_DN17942_c0_g1_i1:168-2219(+)
MAPGRLSIRRSQAHGAAFARRFSDTSCTDSAQDLHQFPLSDAALEQLRDGASEMRWLDLALWILEYIAEGWIEMNGEEDSAIQDLEFVAGCLCVGDGSLKEIQTKHLDRKNTFRADQGFLRTRNSNDVAHDMGVVAEEPEQTMGIIGRSTTVSTLQHLKRQTKHVTTSPEDVRMHSAVRWSQSQNADEDSLRQVTDFTEESEARTPIENSRTLSAAGEEPTSPASRRSKRISTLTISSTQTLRSGDGKEEAQVQKKPRPLSLWRGALYVHKLGLTDRNNPDSNIPASDLEEFLSRGSPWMGSAVPDFPIVGTPLSEPELSQMRKFFDDSLNSWSFNVFDLQTLSRGRPLVYVSWECLCRSGVFCEFELNPRKTGNLLQQVEGKYFGVQTVPYHNKLHAADVIQTVWAMIEDLGLRPYVDPMDTAALLFGAAIHDTNHDGLSNAFHVNAQDSLALTYNDRSVLENHHLATAFHFFVVQESSNILMDLPEKQRGIFRKEIIDMVLATDMTFHFAKLVDFEQTLKKLGRAASAWREDEEGMYMLRSMVLHTADISNQAKPEMVSVRWSLRMIKEFWLQGGEERRRGMQVSPLCDSRNADVPGSQVGFIGFIVHPTFGALAQLLPRARATCVAEAMRNKLCWQNRKEYDVDVETKTLEEHESQKYEAVRDVTSWDDVAEEKVNKLRT